MSISPTVEKALKARCQSIASSHRRRAKELGKVCEYGSRQLFEIACDALVRSFPACVYCGSPLLLSGLSFDHKIPVSRGGVFSLDNLAVCCSACNKIKAELTAEEYCKLVHLLKSLDPRAALSIRNRLLFGTNRMWLDAHNRKAAKRKKIMEALGKPGRYSITAKGWSEINKWRGNEPNNMSSQVNLTKGGQ
jgi:5-methylcytosine-specific restriction endonuclease McrA